MVLFHGLSVANHDSDESNELQKIHFIFKYLLKKFQAVCWSKNVLPYLSPQYNHSSWINTAISDPYSSADKLRKRWIN